MIEALRTAGGLICSQAHPLAGPVALPLCARCAGIWLAAAAGLCLPRVRLEDETRREAVRRYAAAALLVAAAPIHVLLAPSPSDIGRFAAGALAGAGVAAIVGRDPRRTVAIAVVLVCLAFTRSPWVFAAFAMLLPVAVLVAIAVPITTAARIFIPIGKSECGKIPRGNGNGVCFNSSEALETRKDVSKSGSTERRTE